MNDASSFRSVPPRSDPVLGGAPSVACYDDELSRLLFQIRVDFDVYAAVIGLAGTIPDDSVKAAACAEGHDSLDIVAAIPLVLPLDGPLGILILADHIPRSISTDEAGRLAEFAGKAAMLIARRRDASVMDRLHAQSSALQQLVADQAVALAHSRTIFKHASAAARIGVWECTLPDETLSWTDSIYDIFEIPRSETPDRGRTLLCYPEASRALLEQARSRAIAERTGFTLDTEIVTAKGRHRWIRLTATVECEDGIPVRIFGMKQDITEEKTLADRTRYLAEFDVMTELANRAQFQARLSVFAAQRTAGALLLIDLDGFKLVNDTLGHAVGDECLREMALRLRRVCAGADMIARIGGDEFAVLLGADLAAEAVAADIVETLGRPVEREEQRFRVGASVGIAWTGATDPSELFIRADAALYAAKASGRNTVRVFSDALAVLPGPAKPSSSVATLPKRHAPASLS